MKKQTMIEVPLKLDYQLAIFTKRLADLIGVEQETLMQVILGLEIFKLKKDDLLALLKESRSLLAHRRPSDLQRRALLEKINAVLPR